MQLICIYEVFKVKRKYSCKNIPNYTKLDLL